MTDSELNNLLIREKIARIQRDALIADLMAFPLEELTDEMIYAMHDVLQRKKQETLKLIMGAYNAKPETD